MEKFLRLNPMQEKLVIENEKLVYYAVKNFQINYPEEFKDIICIGKIGLIKAALNFDASKSNKFSTYAIPSIKNEVLMYLRNLKKKRNTISLEELEDMIPNVGKNFLEIQIDREECIDSISIILNVLKPMHRIVILYDISGLKQLDISNILNISRSYVSRIRNNAVKVIRSYLTSGQQFDKFFNVDITGELFKISFYSKDQELFNKISEYIKNVTLKEKIPYFNVNYDGKRIIISIIVDLESLYYIAQITEIIDNHKKIDK